jgi:hypothetical protein
MTLFDTLSKQKMKRKNCSKDNMMVKISKLGKDHYGCSPNTTMEKPSRGTKRGSDGEKVTPKVETAKELCKFLNIFTYKTTSPTKEGYTSYEDCEFIKDFGSIKAGLKLKSIVPCLSLLGWSKDGNCDIDESSYLMEE